MYNAEKYVAECLDSILAQTFQNFEVIVVDDCSTDNSVAIVKNYESKFGGRLILKSLKKNSGNAGYTARNKGFDFSCGEYVYFVDADDFITKDALEILYTSAKNFDADVVYTGSRYLFTSAKGVQLNSDIPRFTSYKNGIESKPILTIDDPHKNLRALIITDLLFRVPWTKFVRRNFLTEKEITFPEIISGGDFVWTIELLTLAKNFLQIPNAVYFWRDDSAESMTRKKRPVEKQIIIWNKAFIQFARALTNLSIKRFFLRENPEYCYITLITQLNFDLSQNFEERFQVSSDKIYELLYHECRESSDFDLINPFFLSLIDSHQKNILITQNQLRDSIEQSKKLQERISELENFERVNQAYISELENFIIDSQKRIVELENELKRKS